MSQLQLIHDLDEYVVWFAFLVSVAFTPLVSLIWAWWYSAWGVNIVTLEVAIAFALLPAWLNVAFGLRRDAFFPFAWMQLASVTLVGVVIVWRLVLIWNEQRQNVQKGQEAEVNVSFQKKKEAGGC